MPPRMKEKYKTDVTAKVREQFGIRNAMALPRLEKIVINVGLGNQLEGTKLNPTSKQQVLADLAAIAGQKPVMTLAKKSVSNFKVRAGYESGCMVTLRGDRMWEFLDRLISIAIPRIKDFRGLSVKSFDDRGNYAFGITEQAVFPEINMAEAKYTHGMNIQIVFQNSSRDISRALLTEMGMPFVKPENVNN